MLRVSKSLSRQRGPWPHLLETREPLTSSKPSKKIASSKCCQSGSLGLPAAQGSPVTPTRQCTSRGRKQKRVSMVGKESRCPSRLQYKNLVESRGKDGAAKVKKVSAIEQKKAQDREIQAALKQQRAGEKIKKHEDEERKKKQVKEERCRLFASLCRKCAVPQAALLHALVSLTWTAWDAAGSTATQSINAKLQDARLATARTQRPRH